MTAGLCSKTFSVLSQLSLGDARSYYLSTAERELGVLYAVSSDGHPMEAIGCKFNLWHAVAGEFGLDEAEHQGKL